MTPTELLDALHRLNSRLELTPDREGITITGGVPADQADEIRACLRLNKPLFLALLRNESVVPRLPSELEQLVRAAGAGQVNRGPEGVGHVNEYVSAWAAAYLVGDRDEALRRLWEAHAAWTGQEAGERRAA